MIESSPLNSSSPAAGILGTLNRIRLRLSEDAWEQHVPEVLRTLGTVTASDRAYLFLYHRAVPAQPLKASCVGEWCAPGVSPFADTPALREVDLTRPGFQEMLSSHQVGRPYAKHVQDLPDPFRSFLTSQSVKSVFGVPFFTPGGQLLGFLGFNACAREREWTTAEALALTSVANLLGSLSFNPLEFGIALKAQLVSVCSYCEKIGGSDGVYRNLVDHLAHEHGQVVSHGICPTCTDRTLRELE